MVHLIIFPNNAPPLIRTIINRASIRNVPVYNVGARHTRGRKYVVCIPRCSHKFAYIRTYTHIRTRRQTEHLYGTARLHRLARSCEETMAREISSLRNLDEIARITWEPGRTRIYACAHARGRIHVVVGFCARNTT